MSRMQTGGDEAKLKSSSSLSSFSSSSSSFSSLSFATSSSSVLSMMPRTTFDFSGERVGLVGIGDWTVGEHQFGPVAGSINGGLIPLPNFAAASSATAVNITQSVKVGMGETIDVEQVFHVNRRFTMPAPIAFQSQPVRFLREPSFYHGGSELNPLFPAARSSLIPEPMNNPYSFPCASHDNVGFPSSVVPNLKRKLELLGNPYNSESLPLYAEIPSPYMTGSFYHDSVFQSSSVSVPALHQQHPIFPVSGRHSCMNHRIREPSKLEVFKNQEMNISSASQDVRISRPLGTTFPIHKRKVVRQKNMGTLNMCVASDGRKNVSFPTGLPNQGFQFRDHNALEPVPSLKQPSIPSSSVHHPENLNTENLSKNDKEPPKGWVVMLQKELRNSDVGNLGRIILPKRDCEANLPPLFEREGIILMMEDMVSSFIWEFKYRFWPNNKSRMYVMENTGDFIRTHELQAGDFFIVYKEYGSGKYIVRGKKVPRPSLSTDQVGLNSGKQSNLEKGGSSKQQPPSLSTDQVGLNSGEQSNLEKGGSSKQQPKSNREMEASCPQCTEQERTSEPTGNLLIPKPEPDASPMGFPFDIERDSGGPSQFTQSLPDFDPDMISFDRFLP
ncbi:uncharacterized protein LOC131224673 [Magnolia sinica]|uniref:uncharacterized protein LOC131224673 n=1 Tax=Magnolia sinica TaxID=86752 RepID=UPI0026591E68|nr:uncharacterized protein LOC131224673 [Magnolia sinica]